ncbi:MULTISPECIES: DUF5686 and carboxypeptidase regulatory-like domain-containing protein [unclassified Sphingobacterium]|uniref:DUF5686 and carboxypeptidase regulatory-like domain-containing protein n=1 Tax=unclassified Sphingobacterium TaxID=2609468 RepID=UPI0025EF0933|nr:MULTISPECIES: DUF5686 and carboxypeptidase regulatory-like domain-containing protein [unclassified Sphingobacterium]
MKNILSFLCVMLLSCTLSAQIKGVVTDQSGKPLPSVSVFLQNSTSGTSTNMMGQYELKISKEEKSRTLIFQNLGYKTQIVTAQIKEQPHIINIRLEPEERQIEEVVVTMKGEDPAVRIIRQAIASRQVNAEKNDKYTADFYSKGLLRVKKLPKKILGQKIDDDELALDTARTGVIYLSETVSEIRFQKPDKINEHIVASKVSGDDKGFSFNTAQGTNFDFYANHVTLGSSIVSPLANAAFSYYKFKRENVIDVEPSMRVHKIRVIPVRESEPVVKGYIYIVDGSWEIYGVDFIIKGSQMNQPIIDTLHLIQQYAYNAQDQKWSKMLQTIEFQISVLGIAFDGRYIHNFSNYNYVNAFEKKTFTNVIARIDPLANKKGTDYWERNRPVPLTAEESADYSKKDSIQQVRNSPRYIDSVDRKNNQFRPLDVLIGYTYRNTPDHFVLRYRGLSNLLSTSFNTVQGWNFNAGFSAAKGESEKGKYSRGEVSFNYGLADEQLRVKGKLLHRFNTQTYDILTFEGGRSVEQFNPAEPIDPFLNMAYSLFSRKNYMKIYQKDFAKISYSRNLIDQIAASLSLEYADRRALFNNTDYSFAGREHEYTSNNPLLPEDNTVPVFDPHHLFKYNITARIRPGVKIIERPDERLSIPDPTFPTLLLGWEQAFGASEQKYEYQLIKGRLTQDFDFNNKGLFGIALNAGKFFNASGIGFADFRHFNGNETNVERASRYLNNFLMLPYYTRSTNDAYFEMHAEHNFKGYVMNKVPLLNLLKWNLVLGYHHLAVPKFKPYHEFTAGFDNVGFGKYRIFRVDYVRNLQGASAENGFMISIKLLNVLK